MNMARFKLMGREIHGQEENAIPLSRDEQTRHSPMVVVYETDDNAEAAAIVQAGGFYRDRDNFITVEAVVDSSKTTTEHDQPDTPFFRPSTFPQKGN
jgi:hypothetical protein